MGSLGSDPIMLELFRAELDQHLPVLNEGLLALERGRATREVVESMMRAAHSIKGAGRVMGVDPVVSVAHVLEDCFTAAKEGRVTLTPEAVDVLLAGVDAIQRVCSPDPGDAADEATLAALLARIAAVGDGAASARAAAGNGASTATRASTESSRSAASDPTDHAGQFQPPPAAQRQPLRSATNAEAVVLPRELGAEGAEQLRCRLLERLGGSAPPATDASTGLDLDFSSVERIGPEALAILLSLDPERAAVPMKARVTARGVGPGVRALFRVTGLDGVLAVVV